MDRLVSYYRKFKEMRKDPRKKAITTLILYFIFFAVMFSILGIVTLIEEKDSNKKSTDNFLEPLKFISNYSYNYEITINDEKFIAEGKRYYNQEYIELNDEKYFIIGSNFFKLVDGNLETVDENPFVVDILKFRPDKIYEYINNSNEFISSNDSGQYALDLKKFLSLNNEFLTYDSKVINISAEKTNDGIRVWINLNSYITLIDSEVLNYEVVVYFKEFNQVKEFDINGNEK